MDPFAKFYEKKSVISVIAVILFGISFTLAYLWYTSDESGNLEQAHKECVATSQELKVEISRAKETLASVEAKEAKSEWDELKKLTEHSFPCEGEDAQLLRTHTQSMTALIKQLRVGRQSLLEAAERNQNDEAVKQLDKLVSKAKKIAEEGHVLYDDTDGQVTDDSLRTALLEAVTSVESAVDKASEAETPTEIEHATEDLETQIAALESAMSAVNESHESFTQQQQQTQPDPAPYVPPTYVDPPQPYVPAPAPAPQPTYTPDPAPQPSYTPSPDPVPVPDPTPAPAPDPVPDPTPAPVPDPAPDPAPAPSTTMTESP